MFFALSNSCTQNKEEKKQEAGSTEFDKHAGYVGSKECKSCHAAEFDDWQKSDHFRAMQHANDTTVLGDFNDKTFTADGVTSKFYKKDGSFYINTEGSDGKYHEYKVLFTFGYYPLQQYLVELSGGRLQATRVSWNSKDKKWFHQYAGQKIFHGDWQHWTGNGQNWNTMCASCHSTNLVKNYDSEQDLYSTSYSEINVGCETCHGQGGKHIAYIKSKEYEGGERIANSGLYYSKDTISQLQLNTCAPCHARKTDLSAVPVHSAELLDDLIPQAINNEFYFADGQIKEEDYEYGSFSQSKMFHNNVRCANCHNVHSGKLKMTGNNLCLSCHKPSYDSPQHHFHPVNTEASQCINCHMPRKTFMGVDQRRDHSLRVPRPDQSVLYGTPNTCTSCHTNKSNQWAADAVVKWYGEKRAYHFSDNLLPGSLMNERSEVHLIKLLEDTTQPEIARATAAGYLGEIQTRQSADALVRAINDTKPLIRYHALRSLQNFPAEIWSSYAYKLLTDKVKAVRIAAADLYHRMSPDEISPDYKDAYTKADAENRDFLKYQTDFSVGNVMFADYHLQGGDNLNAIIYYLRGLKKDSLMNYARLNLSASYNAIGKNDDALKTLNEAAAIDPKNDRIYYNLGLLYSELGKTEKSLENFQKAVKLNSPDPRVYYNYGIALQQKGNLKEAELIYLKGLSLNPSASNLNYAMAYLYLSTGQPEKAKKYAEILKRIDPGNPDYQMMFRNMGL